MCGKVYTTDKKKSHFGRELVLTTNQGLSKTRIPDYNILEYQLLHQRRSFYCSTKWAELSFNIINLS